MKTLDLDIPSKKDAKKKKIIIMIACENRTRTTVARHKAPDSLGTSRRPHRSGSEGLGLKTDSEARTRPETSDSRAELNRVTLISRQQLRPPRKRVRLGHAKRPPMPRFTMATPEKEVKSAKVNIIHSCTQCVFHLAGKCSHERI